MISLTRHRIQMGLSDELFAYPLAAGENLRAGSDYDHIRTEGLSKLSQQYHHCIMNHICRADMYMKSSNPDQ